MSSTAPTTGYTLPCTPQLGRDSGMATVLVQNRVRVALPVIPTLVQNEDNVKKMSRHADDREPDLAQRHSTTTCG